MAPFDENEQTMRGRESRASERSEPPQSRARNGRAAAQKEWDSPPAERDDRLHNEENARAERRGRERDDEPTSGSSWEQDEQASQQTSNKRSLSDGAQRQFRGD